MDKITATISPYFTSEGKTTSTESFVNGFDRTVASILLGMTILPKSSRMSPTRLGLTS